MGFLLIKCEILSCCSHGDWWPIPPLEQEDTGEREPFPQHAILMLWDYRKGLYTFPSFCLMLTINVYQIQCREPLCRVTLPFNQPAQIPKDKVVLSVSTTLPAAPSGITLRVLVVIRVSLRFTREKGKKTWSMPRGRADTAKPNRLGGSCTDFCVHVKHCFSLQQKFIHNNMKGISVFSSLAGICSEHFTSPAPTQNHSG